MEYLEFKKVSKYECYRNTGITNGVLSQSNGLSEDNLMRFLSYYTDISYHWLFTGNGPMLRADGEPTLSATPSTDTPAPSDTVVLRLMEKIDEKDAKIDQLQSELRQQSAELAALKAKYPEEPADNPAILKTAKPASTKKRSSPPDTGSATSANVHSK